MTLLIRRQNGLQINRWIWLVASRQETPGGRLNIKMSSYQCRNHHVKDKTVSPTVLSLTWESPYLEKTAFILRQGPGHSQTKWVNYACVEYDENMSDSTWMWTGRQGLDCNFVYKRGPCRLATRGVCNEEGHTETTTDFTWCFDFVGNDATHKMRMGWVQHVHQPVQWFLGKGKERSTPGLLVTSHNVTSAWHNKSSFFSGTVGHTEFILGWGMMGYHHRIFRRTMSIVCGWSGACPGPHREDLGGQWKVTRCPSEYRRRWCWITSRLVHHALWPSSLNGKTYKCREVWKPEALL